MAGRIAEPRRRPQQERSRETVIAILQATAEIIVDQGYDHASTNRIAKRAGVSVGSLYQYFPNKEAILVALHEEHMRQVGGVIEHFLDRLEDPGFSLAEALRALFHELVEVHAVDPRLSRALSRETPRPVVAKDHAGEDPGDRVEAALRRRADVHVRDYAITTRILAQTAGGLSRWLVHDAPEGFDVDTFIEDSVAMMIRYTERPTTPPGPA